MDAWGGAWGAAWGGAWGFDGSDGTPIAETYVGGGNLVLTGSSVVAFAAGDFDDVTFTFIETVVVTPRYDVLALR